jgi:hypothetical protein
MCGIIIAAISAAHLLFILLHTLFAKTPLGPALRFPRFEVRGSPTFVCMWVLFVCVFVCVVCVCVCVCVCMCVLCV